MLRGTHFLPLPLPEFNKPVMKRFLIGAMAVCLTVSSTAQPHSAVPKTVAINDNCGGYYEFLPAGYNDAGNASSVYPLLVDVQGTGSEGDGSQAQLGKLVKYGAAYYITEGRFPEKVVADGQPYSFIVISAQFKQRGSGSDVDALIDFLRTEYRVDTNRIYLSGFSAGGEPVWRYPCLGANYSGIIAAMVPIAGVNTNKTHKGVDHIVAAALPVWALHSKDDNVAMTPVENSVNFVNKINELNPPVPATFTMLTGSHSETWPKVYDPEMRYEVNGKQLNIYEWMLQYNRVTNVLPVQMLIYDISLSNLEDVTVKWQTAKEQNNDFFTIERSLNGERFEEVAQVPGSLNNGNGAAYTWIDQSPVHGKSWYRLSQTDKNGKKEYFDVKEIFIQDRAAAIKIFPTVVRDNTIRVALPGYNEGVAQFKVVDINGAIVHQSSANTGGSSTIQLTMDKWSQGLHVVEVRWNGTTERVKVMKQ